LSPRDRLCGKDAFRLALETKAPAPGPAIAFRRENFNETRTDHLDYRPARFRAKERLRADLVSQLTGHISTKRQQVIKETGASYVLAF
jgi:hypothetical protein